MSVNIDNSEVDIVIAALWPDLTAFLEAWQPFFSPFHLIIVKDPDLEEDLQLPPGFDLQVYMKANLHGVISASSINFSGYSCRYFGHLVSRKKYVISIDDDCLPAKDNNGALVDAVAQHLSNLETPATPFFFNMLYDPFRKGADFVRGYPFSMRSGVECVLSCGLWLNIADYDAITKVAKPHHQNTRYIDGVMTVSAGAMMPASGVNIGFNRVLLGPALALLPGLRLPADGKHRWGTLEDIWSGLCAKAVCNHLGLGVKTGLPYVWRGEAAEGGHALERLKKDWGGVKIMEESLPFFEMARLLAMAESVEDCVKEMATMVRERLGPKDSVFVQAADAMEEWINLWKSPGSQSG